MPYSNTPPVTTQDTIWASNTAYASYSSITTLPGIPHEAQIYVERIFDEEGPSSQNTLADFLNDPDIAGYHKHNIFRIPSAYFTVNSNEKRVSINLVSGEGAYIYTVGGVSVKVPVIAQNDTVTIGRQTISNTPLVTWVPGTKLTPTQLNQAMLQNLYLSQEMINLVNYKLLYTGTPTDAGVATGSIEAAHLANGCIQPIHITTDVLSSWAFSGPSITLTSTNGTSLYGPVILPNLQSSRAVFTDSTKGLVSVGISGSGSVILQTGATLIAPHLGTIASGNGATLSGTATGLTSGTCLTIPTLTGQVTSSANALTITNDTVTNAHISSIAGITDGKLAQIISANKVANSATTATTLSTNDAIVSRHPSTAGFSAGPITSTGFTGPLIGNVTGSATTVTAGIQNNITQVGFLTDLTVNGGITSGGTLNLSNASASNNIEGSLHVEGNLTTGSQFLFNYISQQVPHKNFTIGSKAAVVSGSVNTVSGLITITAIPDAGHYVSDNSFIFYNDGVTYPTLGGDHIRIIGQAVPTGGESYGRLGRYYTTPPWTTAQEGTFNFQVRGSNNAQSDGGGLVLFGTPTEVPGDGNKTLLWRLADDAWEPSRNLAINNPYGIKFRNVSSNGLIFLKGSTQTSGTWNLNLPSIIANDVIVSKTSIDTLSNKSLLFGASGNVLTFYNGVATVVDGTTGTGSYIVRSVAPEISAAVLSGNTQLGTPVSGTLTSCTGLPISTGVTGLGTNVLPLLQTFNLGNLAAALTSTYYTGLTGGSSKVVFSDSPQLITPKLGAVHSADLSSSDVIYPENMDTNASSADLAGALKVPLTGVITMAAESVATSLRSNALSPLVLWTALTGKSGVSPAVNGASLPVFSVSPALVTPVLGTPQSGTLSACDGLPLTSGTTGTLGTARGGTGLTSYVTGDIVYANNTNTLAPLTKGTPGQVLTMNPAGTLPIWLSPGLTSRANAAEKITGNGTNAQTISLLNSATVIFQQDIAISGGGGIKTLTITEANLPDNTKTTLIVRSIHTSVPTHLTTLQLNFTTPSSYAYISSTVSHSAYTSTDPILLDHLNGTQPVNWCVLEIVKTSGSILVTKL